MTDLNEWFSSPPMGYPMAGMEPLCGWEWYEAHKDDVLPEQSIEVCYNGKTTLRMNAKAKAGSLKEALKGFKHSCENVRGIG